MVSETRVKEKDKGWKGTEENERRERGDIEGNRRQGTIEGK